MQISVDQIYFMDRENRARRHRSGPISHHAVELLTFFAHQRDPHPAAGCDLVEEFFVNFDLPPRLSGESSTLGFGDALRDLLHQILQLGLLGIDQVLNGLGFSVASGRFLTLLGGLPFRLNILLLFF